jgi:cellulose synthase/poly-beta-1,6-N-acetylglucosamine synthase-like glycosyltransferase
VLSPLVSVIIPTFTRPQSIIKAVHSALAQTVSNIEVIVVDDASNPSDGQALLSINDSRLSIIDVAEHIGRPGAVRNVGLHRASGEWIAFLDSDDLWFPWHLWTGLQWLDTSGGGFVSTTHHAPRDPIGGSSENGSVLTVDTGSLLMNNPILTSSVICRRELIEEAGRFPEKPCIYEDYALWLRFSTLCTIDVLPIRSIEYSSTPDSISSLTPPVEARRHTFLDFLEWLETRHSWEKSV